MADIAFSMTADEKDVVRGLQSVGKSTGKLREDIAGLVTASKEAGAADNQLAQQRLAALAPILAKQKELRAAQEALATQAKEGKISADQYRQSFDALAKESATLTTDLNKLQAQIKEDTADMKRAGVVIGQTEDKTEKYARAVKELDRLKAKGILTSKQHTTAIAAEQAKLNDTGVAAEKSGGMVSGLTGKMAGFVGGLASAGAVIGTIKAEYDALIERQGKSRDANISLAAEQEALLMNLGDADAKEVTGQIRDLSQSSGVKEENVTRAVNEAMAARADLDIKDVLDAVGTAAKVRKFAPSELAGLASATIDTQKQTGLGTDESLGFLMQLQAQSRTKDLKGLAENFTPAVGGIMNFGADRETAGGILAALSHGMGDTTGAQTGTSGIQLAKQLRAYGQQGGPEMQAKMAELDATQERQKAALKADFDKRGIALNAEKMDPAEKAELRRQLAAEKKVSEEKLKATHDTESEALQATAQTIPIADVLARMQADPAYRAQFLKGKDQGGFGASFEAKALPAIESLLSGGTQATQYATAKEALQLDPTNTLKQAIANRDLPALNLAEKDHALANISDQQKLADTTGAESAIARDRLQEFRDQSGRWKMSSKAQAVYEDITSGGNQTAETTVQAMESEIAMLKTGSTDTTRAMRGNVGALGLAANLGGAALIESRNRNSPETQKLIKELEALVALTKQQLEVTRQSKEDNKNKAHAGAVAAKINDREGR